MRHQPMAAAEPAGRQVIFRTAAANVTASNAKPQGATGRKGGEGGRGGGQRLEDEVTMGRRRGARAIYFSSRPYRARSPVLSFP